MILHINLILVTPSSSISLKMQLDIKAFDTKLNKSIDKLGRAKE